MATKKNVAAKTAKLTVVGTTATPKKKVTATRQRSAAKKIVRLTSVALAIINAVEQAHGYTVTAKSQAVLLLIDGGDYARKFMDAKKSHPNTKTAANAWTAFVVNVCGLGSIDGEGNLVIDVQAIKATGSNMDDRKRAAKIKLQNLRTITDKVVPLAMRIANAIDNGTIKRASVEVDKTGKLNIPATVAYTEESLSMMAASKRKNVVTLGPRESSDTTKIDSAVQAAREVLKWPAAKRSSTPKAGSITAESIGAAASLIVGYMMKLDTWKDVASLKDKGARENIMLIRDFVRHLDAKESANLDVLLASAEPAKTPKANGKSQAASK